MPDYFRTGPPWAHNFFRGQGYRCTKARDLILNLLFNTSEHLSAEDIYIKIHKKHPDIGLTTVYRTLDLLSRIGVVRRFDFGDGRARFEMHQPVNKKGHHHHLICTGCNRVVDYDDFVEEEIELVKKTEQQISEKYGYRITDHLIQFYGVCSRCREKENRKSRNETETD